jgi:hypothetical protein
MNRLPLLPLIALAEREGRTSPEIRAMFRLSGTAWAQRDIVTISLWRADRLAVQTGRHPAEVWGDDWIFATTGGADRGRQVRSQGRSD